MAASGAAFAAAETDAARAVSTALCADTYVLALGGEADIAALSWQVDQPVSAAPEWARALPRASDSAERLLRLDGELFVFGPGEAAAAERLERAGRETHQIDWGEDFDSVSRNLRALGEAWGRPDRAERAIAEMAGRLQALDERARRREAVLGLRPRIVYLSASGASAGRGTFIDAVIDAAGGRNAAAEAGLAGWGRADAEFALQLEGELIALGFFDDGFRGVHNTGARHAAYRRLLNSAPRLDLRSADLICAGPRLIDAAEALADALDREAGR